MASETFNGLKVAIMVTDGFVQVEMIEPRRALDEAATDTRLVSPTVSQVNAWNFTDWGDSFAVNVPLEHGRAEEFGALVLPGGVIDPGQLLTLRRGGCVRESVFKAGKPVASICQGPWTIMEAGEARMMGM